MSDRTRNLNSTNGDSSSKPLVDGTNFRYNYYKILGWCRRFGLFDEKCLRDFECVFQRNDGTEIREKFQTLLNQIERATHKHASVFKVFENIYSNLLLLENPKLEEYTEKDTDQDKLKCGHLDMPNIEKTRKPSTNTSAVPAYEMKTANRGVLFFVNIINFPTNKNNPVRNGAEYDKFYMIRLFSQYGYKIYYYEDLMVKTFLNLVDRLIHNNYLDDVESLVFILATHGDANNDVEFYYNQTLDIKDIVSKFNNLDCSKMVGKPKVFLFPCCRGYKPDKGVPRNIQTDGSSINDLLYSDILIAYASVHGFATMRDVNYGSWYLEAFYNVLAANGHVLDLESILRKVVIEVSKSSERCNRKCIAEKKDCIFLTPSFAVRDFNKLLFFNPGYVEKN